MEHKFSENIHHLVNDTGERESDRAHYPAVLRESLVAAIEEMRVWVILMAEHAKFIRMGIDPNPEQEQFFRQADQFAIQLEQLHHTIQNTSNEAPIEALEQLRDQTIKQVNQLIQFKKTLFQLIEQCRALAIISGVLEDHVRREADRFVGTLERSKGQITRSRNELGIPDGQTGASTVPRLLYHRLAPQELFKVGIEEMLFFSRVNSEHAHHLSMTFRPEVQEQYRQVATFYEREFANQVTHAQEVERTGTGMEVLIRNGLTLSNDFNRYLMRLLDEITTCRIPDRQTNFPPLIADHMRRETVYYIDILERLQR